MRPARIIFGLWAVWVVWGWAVSVQGATATLGQPEFTGTEYLIDGDAGITSYAYNRDTIPVRVGVGMAGPFSEPVRLYRVRFRLLEEGTGEEFGSAVSAEIA